MHNTNKQWARAAAAPRLQLPLIGNHVVRRSRCLNLLKREAYRTLIALVAPMGYGKTTLMGEWAHSLASRHKVGWLTLEAEDQYVHRFLHDCILSLPLGSEEKQQLLEQWQLIEDAQLPLLLQLMDTIAVQLNALDEVYLFFDRYEIIREASVHRLMEYLITRVMKHIHIYIASRDKLPFYSSIQSLHPGPLTVSHEHLKLSPADIQQFVKHATKLHLPNDAAARLEQLTEGWFPAVAIYSSFLDGSRAQPRSEQLPPAEVIQSDVYERFLTDIFRQQPPDLQRFMLHTSIPDYFHAELGFVLTEDAGYNAYLEQLVRHSLFLFQADNGQYRYHNLFLRFLRIRFKELDKPRYHLMHGRSSVWFEQHGYVLEAVRHALHTADYDRASGLLLADMAVTFSYSKQDLIGLLERFPESEIHRRPSVAMLYAWCLTAEHRITAAETVLHKTEAYMTDDRCVFSPTGEDLRGYIASIYSRIYFLRRNTEKGLAYMLETGERLNGPGYLYSHANTLDPGGSSLLKCDVGHWGAIDQSIAMCEVGKAAWNGFNQGYGIIESLLGECYYERNELVKAEKFLLNGRKIGLDLMDTGLLLPTTLTLVHLKHEMGEQQAAQSLLEETGKLLLQHSPNTLPVIHACQARMDMKTGQWAPAKKWLTNQILLTEGELDKRHMYSYLTILRAYIYLHQYGHGIRFGERLLQHCQALYLPYYIAEIQLLLAVLYERKGDAAAAMRKIELAVLLGREEGYIRLFLDLWELAEPIVKKYARRVQQSSEAASFMEQLIQYSIEEDLYSDKTGLAHKKLSSKEYKVLQLLIQGQSNAAIAENLSITIETVKTHCKHIYKKLRLKSRKDVQKHYVEM